MNTEFGYYVEGEFMVCPECADNPLYKGLLTIAEQVGYPEGYTCADCGVTYGVEEN